MARLGRLLRIEIYRGEEGQESHDALRHGHINHASLASLSATRQGSENTNDGHQAAASQIAQLSRRHGWLALLSTIIVEQSGIARVIQVMPGTQTIGTILAIATDSTVDDTGIGLFELLVAQTQAVKHIGSKALQHHISVTNHIQKYLTAQW